MEKSPQAFRTISEVSETIDVPAHVLRFWESRFTQIRPVKRGGGRRYYRPEDVELLKVIRELLYTEGLTIRGVQKLMRETGPKQLVEKYAGTHLSIDDFTPADEPAPNGAAKPDAEPPKAPVADPEKREQLRDILGRLEDLRARMAQPLDGGTDRD
ncbi:MAG: MerR family transcriptional regulator [Rubricella sp.]